MSSAINCRNSDTLKLLKLGAELLAAKVVCAVFFDNAAESLQAFKMFLHHRFFTHAQVPGSTCESVPTIDDAMGGDLLQCLGS